MTVPECYKVAAHPDWWYLPPATLRKTRLKTGYVAVQVLPGVWEAEHRLVLAQKIGRALRDGESAHHVNGVRHDNRPDNLELWRRGQPAGQRVDERLCPHCGGEI